MKKKNKNDDTSFQALLSERSVIIALVALLAFFWSISLIDPIAAVIVAAAVSGLLIQLEIKKRIVAHKERRENLKKERDAKQLGVKSVRANTLNGVPLPILIIRDDHRIAFANTAALDLLGGKIVDTDVLLYLRQPKFVEALNKIFEQGEKAAGTLRYSNKQKRSFDVSISRVSGTGKRDVPAQAMAFFYEVTSMLQTEQMRVDFVANASHELRTPLSSLMGFIETLQGPAKDDPPAQERFLGIMQTEAERMIRLIDDLLSLSKIEMSRHEVPDTPTDLSSLIESVVLTASAVAKTRDIVFDTKVDEGAGSVIADADQLLQVLLNLTVNAAKYADEGTTVHVSAVPTKGGKYVTVSIRDEGPGIAEEHLARLTERFYRVDDARSRQMGGTGLGLAIVKHILIRHESALDVSSEPGIGTTFSFRLRRVTKA